MSQDGNHPKKLIKKVNNHNPSFTSVGMAAILKPEIAAKDIPERTGLLYLSPNEANFIPYPHQDMANKQEAVNSHLKQEKADSLQPHHSFDTDGPALSKFLNAPNTTTIKQIQSAGYDIISNT